MMGQKQTSGRISICLEENCYKTPLHCLISTLFHSFGCWWFPFLWKGWGALNPALGQPNLAPSPGPGKDTVRTHWCMGSANRGNVNFCAQFTTLRVMHFNSKCLLKKKLKLSLVIQFSFFCSEMETRYVYFNKSIKQVSGLNSWCLFLK